MKLSTFVLIGLIAATPLTSRAQDRRRERIDGGWKFLAVAPPKLNESVVIKNFRVLPGRAEEAEAVARMSGTEAGWQEAGTGRDVFALKPGFAYYRAVLPALKPGRRYLSFAAVDDNATVYLNGKKLAHNEGWHIPFEVALDSAWSETGPNVLLVQVEYAKTTPLGGITDVVTLRSAAEGNPESSMAPPMQGARTVHLPHDYVVESGFDAKGDPSRGSLIPTAAWYEKTFRLPESDRGKSLWIDFDGVYRDSTVYLNGVCLGKHACGYTPFRFDISRQARYGAANVLRVKVNAQRAEGWWYEGGGIYRHVWLNAANRTHVAPWGVFVTSEDKRDKAEIKIRTKVENAEKGVKVVSRVLDAAGNTVGVAYGTDSRIMVKRPRLWSIEKPYLYRVHTEVWSAAGRVVDTTDTTFGIRTVRFDAQRGLLLNGQAVKIKGTCNHQDFIGVGVAMPDSLLEWRIRKLKEMGSNAYRCAHNPPTAELLDACDRLGMLVMDENRHLGNSEAGKASPGTPYADLREVESMVLRDRNHPSIIMWSMCNEEGIQATAAAARIFKAMKLVVDRADGTRPVTCGMNGGYDSPVGITSVQDIQGINYLPGDYDSFHRVHPRMPLFASETSSAVGTRGVYARQAFKIDGVSYLGDQAQSYVSAYDVNAPSWAQTAESAWRPIADREFVAGGFVWTGFDYKGEPTPFGWPAINSFFGIMDMCGFPKDNYYYYQSVWMAKPIVHILPHWNGCPGQTIEVVAYSNADRVELLLNGKSLGSQLMVRNSHLTWSVPFAPGALEARGYRGDKLTCRDFVETTGAPAALRLRTDKTQLWADGEELAPVVVEVVDAQGRVVPTAADRVEFTVTGKGTIGGVGNGNPTDHDPDQSSNRKAFQGRCMVLVRTLEKAGTIEVTAQAHGLAGAKLRLNARRLHPQFSK